MNEGQGQLPEGWEVKKLGEVCDIINGKNQSNVVSENGKFPIYGSSGNLMGYATQYICEKGTTIIGRKGNISNPIFINERFWNVDTAFGLFPKYDYNPKFINYLCQTIDFKSRNRGTTIPSLVKSDLLNIDVPFIKILSSQQRVVAILDKTFAAIAKAKAIAERNLQNAKALFESYLQGVFENKGEGWEEKKLGQIAKINYGFTEKASFEKIGPKFLRITDVQDNCVDWNKVPYCRCREADIPKYKLETGDIVFARTGATTGKSYLIKNLPIAVFASYLIRLRMNSLDDFVPEFISYFFQTHNYWNKINQGISGSAQGGFNASKLGELEFIFPKTLLEQQSIVRSLDALKAETQKLERIYQQKIVALEELKKSILQKAFSGELVTENEVAV